MFELYRRTRANLRTELLSGLTVALALVPEAIAFAFVAGVEPLVGLYAAAIVGFITAVVGGRPGMISGATGALAVVMVALVAQHGVQYLFATVVLMGLLQIVAGVLRLGKFIRMVPHPVMLGFVNGLAIVIFLSQLNQFKVTDDVGNMVWMSGNDLYLMLGLVALTMFIIHFFPKLTRTIPASLVAILSVTLLVIVVDINTPTVLDFLRSMSGDVNSTIAGGLPSFSIPMVPLTLETFRIILPYAFILAAIGLIESLLTLTLIDEITNTRGRGNKECIGQGAANVVTGFFGGMGGCAMIGQSMINVNSGGRGRVSGISAALLLMMFILVGSKLIEIIPIAALVGVMFIVVLGTFEWSSFRIMNKVPKQDAFVIVLVSAVTVITDLAIAVLVGVIVSALVFAWKQAKLIHVHHYEEKGSSIYELDGLLFFGSTTRFLELFDTKNDLDDVVVEFQNARVIDHSAIEAIDTLAERYESYGKKLHLRHLSADCRKLLTKAGSLVEVNVIEDPQYAVADDALS